jgi:hypothetical protein
VVAPFWFIAAAKLGKDRRAALADKSAKTSNTSKNPRKKEEME